MARTLTGRKRAMPAPAARGTRAWVAGIILALAVLGALAAGYWGLFAIQQRSDNENAAAIGEVIEVPGGEARVDGVFPEIIEPLHTDHSNLPDPVPEGYRRFTVQVTLLGLSAQGLRYSPDSFTVTAEGMEPTGPRRANIESGRQSVVPEGMGRTVSLLFQAPEDVDQLHLSFKGGERSVLLIEGGPGSGHDQVQ